MSEPYWVPMASAPVDYQGAYDPAVAYAQGAVVLYNGVTYIAVNPSLGQTPPIAGNLGGVPLVTSLPGSPNDGDEIVLTDSLTAPTFSWRLKYVAAKATNKWVFIGGNSVYSELTGPATTSDTTGNYLDLSPNVSWTAPVAGIFAFEFLADLQGSTTTLYGLALKFGAAATADADAWALPSSTNPNTMTAHRAYNQAVLAGDLVKA